MVVILKIQLRTSDGFKISKRYELATAERLEEVLKSIDTKMLELHTAYLFEAKRTIVQPK